MKGNGMNTLTGSAFMGFQKKGLGKKKKFGKPSEC
jgi:hypothetical protein